jgi:small-conductance mechanosensitive channel
MVVIAVLAGLMALSALGVEIGPLIAGAGVLGVAVGFGAQTVVKDIISGIFFLLDDAFRVGEYIQSGSYKGTVESFSLRSIKLRHHRGPVFTVPFGDLGAVQNMSRDWVIDKFMIAVTYDTNLEKARKLIKNIGQDLAADPELGKQVIEPLKMQGVEQFGDYGIQIRMKMTTKPGEQFVIRRKALARIKQAFDENGIRFALPSVQVGGSEEGTAPAAAQQVVERLRPIPPPVT